MTLWRMATRADERAGGGADEMAGDVHLGFGRILASEIEAPNMLAIPV
jgi:hypothetical protein